jgi:hypothetical protein
VTRVNATTASPAGKRAKPAVFAALLAAVLAGCSTSNQTAQAPAEIAPAQTTNQVASVSLAPVAAPGSVSNKMGQMLETAAKEKNIPIKDDGAEYTVRGYLVASPESEGTKVSYIWDITDKSGKRAHRFSGEEMVEERVSGDPWAAVDEQAMRKIAMTTADRLQQWLPKTEVQAPQVATTGSVNATSTTGQPDQQRSQLASAQPASSDILVAVPEVTGAPGDGNTALPAAMRRELQSRGMKLIESNQPSAYTVRGTVELGSAEDGQQPITIRWLVLGPDGEPLKNAVVQRNKIREGSLDGSWGRVADIAAGEAAKAVAEILPDPTS